MGISVRTGKPVQPDTNSAVYNHWRQTGHKMDFDHFKFIGRTDNAFYTQIREALQISPCKPNLNSQIEQPFLFLLQNWWSFLPVFFLFL